MDVQEIVAGIASAAGFSQAAQKAGIEPDQARLVLQGVLEHVDGGGGIIGSGAAVAAKTGLPLEQVEAFLPQVMPLVQSHAANGSQAAQQMVGAFVKALGIGGGGGLAGLVGGLFRRR